MTKKQIRQKFREAVFARDGYHCRVCGEHRELQAHHILNRNDIPNGGYVLENGITVCPTCHQHVENAWWEEQYATRHGVEPQEVWRPYISDSLFKLIDSSKELAYSSAMRS